MANNYPTYNLTNQTPASTYINLVQINYASSSLVDGDGNELDGVVNVTSSYTVTASNAVTSSYSLNISPTDTSSFAITASYALNISPADSASYATFAISSSVVSITPTVANQNFLLVFTSNSGSVTPVIDGGLTSYYNPFNDTLTLLNLSSSLITASIGIMGTLNGAHTGSTFGTASWSTNVVNIGSASWASASLNDSVSPTVAGPYYFELTTGSSGLQQTYISTGLIYNTVNNALSTTNFSGSLYGTASWASNITSSGILGTVTNSSTASFLNGPATASVWGTASWANNISSSGVIGNLLNTASWANNLNGTASWASNITSSGIVGTVANSLTASFLNGPATGSVWGTASWASTALTSSFCNGPHTGSQWGTSSWASNITSSGIVGNISSSTIVGNLAATASYASASSWGTGIPQIQAGVVTGLSGVTKATVTFNTAFPNTNYSLTVMPSGSYLPSGSFISGSLNVTGAIVCFGLYSYTGNLYWMAISM
jgi:hypothetical protein